MTCALCGKKKAHLKVERTIGGRASHLWLCDRCADSLGIARTRGLLDPTVGDLMGGLFEQENVGEDQKGGDMCPECGHTYREFQRTGTVGCSHCYVAFRSAIERVVGSPVLAPQHRGRYPRRLASFKAFFVDREVIRQEMKEAVQAEDFERAASLRDRLAEIDQRGNEDIEHN